MANYYKDRTRIAQLADLVGLLLHGAKFDKTTDGHYVIFRGQNAFSLVNREDYHDAVRIAEQYRRNHPDKAEILSRESYHEAYNVAKAVMDIERLIEMDSSFLSPRPEKTIHMLNVSQGCALWRMSIPADAMEQEGIGVNLYQNNSPDFISYVRPGDVIYAHWVSMSEVAAEIQWAQKNLGVRLVYDMDDSYVDVHEDNPMRFSMDVCGVAVMAKCSMMADVITTTTDILAERISKYLPGSTEVVVIPNAIDVGNPGWRPLDKCGSKDGRIRIMWAGGTSHQADLAICIDAIDTILRKYWNVDFMIAGYLSPEIKSRQMSDDLWKSRVEFLGAAQVYEYFGRLQALDADIGICPLEDTQFNRCKSDIKFQEYTMAGLATIASRVTPYKEIIRHKETGLLPKNTTEDWVYCMSMLIENEKKRKRMIEKARESVYIERNISNFSSKWRSVLLGE